MIVNLGRERLAMVIYQTSRIGKIGLQNCAFDSYRVITELDPIVVWEFLALCGCPPLSEYGFDFPCQFI